MDQSKMENAKNLFKALFNRESEEKANTSSGYGGVPTGTTTATPENTANKVDFSYAKPESATQKTTVNTEEAKQQAYQNMVNDRNQKLEEAQTEMNYLNDMQSRSKKHGGVVNSEKTEYGTYYQFGDGTGYWIDNEDELDNATNDVINVRSKRIDSTGEEVGGTRRSVSVDANGNKIYGDEEPMYVTEVDVEDFPDSTSGKVDWIENAINLYNKSGSSKLKRQIAQNVYDMLSQIRR